MKKKLAVLSGFALSLAPALVLAQTSTTGTVTVGCAVGPGGTLFDFICRIGQIINSIVPVLIALAVLYFIWGVVSYVVGGDEETKKKGRDKIIYGIIGLAVIVAVWGLVRVLTNTFGVNNTSNITLPTVPVKLGN